MKRFRDLVEPYLCVVFGALLFLVYLNYLQLTEYNLARGIIAVVLSAFYLGAGIVKVVVGDKLPKTAKDVFEAGEVSLFPLFMFVNILLRLIERGSNEWLNIGPTAWLLAILGMIGSLAVVVAYVVAKATKSGVAVRLAQLFAIIFALVLLLEVLFDPAGFTNTLAEISIVLVVLYVLYAYMLIATMAKLEVCQKQEKQEEAVPQEEQPAEAEEKKEDLKPEDYAE